MPSRTSEQQAAIDSLDEHVIVSAGAGSGKTFVLVERYLEVLRKFPEATVSEIVAVTFTRKAAEEMRSRLKLQLKQIAESCGPEEQEKWFKHLSEIDGAKIGTIHSLCENVLKSFPAEARIDPSFEIFEDLERAEILEECIDGAVRRLLENPNAYSLELLDYSVETIKGWLAEFLKSPLRYKEACRPLGDCSIQSIRTYAQEFVSNYLQNSVNAFPQNRQFQAHTDYLTDNLWPDKDNQLALKQQELIPLLQVCRDADHYSLAERWQVIVMLAELELSRAGGPKGKDLRESIKWLRDYAKDFCKKLEPQLNEADEKSIEILSSLLSLTNYAFSKYEQAKHKKQKLDFDDLISKTSEVLLAEHSIARRYISKNLRAILVDEFQDTNWQQAKLLSSLAGFGAKLFLIGDDKQSIYKFQGADVGVFNTCKNLISSLENQESTNVQDMPSLSGKGKLLSLSTSFRSHPQIVGFVNFLFEKLLSSEESGQSFRARFQGLHASREGAFSDERVEILCYDIDDETSAANAADQEAALIASWIQEKIDQAAPIFDKQIGESRPIQYGDIAVLVQANADFAPVEWSLSKAGIPYITYAGSGYLERQEVYDLENLLKWLVCKQDSHALFAVLRSPIFGFSDDLLHKLKAGYSGSLWSALRSGVTAFPEPRISRAYALLNQLSRESNRCGTADLVREVILKTSYDMILLSLPGGRQRSRNVYKFLTLATKYDHLSLADFLRSLQTLRDLNVKNLTDAPLIADNAVKVMTIHGSKGLEFGAIAIFRLARRVHSFTAKLLFSKDTGIALDCTKDRDDKKPAFYLAANGLNRQMEEEEKKRLFYVALTRARDYLGLFLQTNARFSTSFALWLESILDLPKATISEEGFNHQLNDQGMQICLRQVQPTAISPAAKTSTDLEPERQQTSFALLESPAPDGQEPGLPPIRWQSLMRISPGEDEASVHPTILGSYFHLLMSETQNPAEPKEENFLELCFHPEIAVWHQALQETLIKEGKRLSKIFAGSQLQELLRSARRTIHETPYTMIREGKLQSESRPDLILEDAQGSWHIIDYKTDHFDLSEIEKQTETHREQLSRYATDFAALSGYPAQAWLYFAQFGILKELPVKALAKPGRQNQ